MATITEDYCSYEVAKLLKEKRFDEKCKYCYAYFDDNDIRVFELRPNKNAQNLAENRYPYMTHQMAMKWLRNTFHLEIYPFHDAIQENNDWWYKIEKHSKGCSLTEHESDAIYKTYEQACESAIKYCLENLI